MATQTLTPPALQGPTAKEKKYDRQLRLWAASGQEALEQAHVLLLNSGPGVVGVEVLKNLILPGIGNFTIVDEENVTEKDLGINFFLTDDSLGKPRASETCKYLTELNPDVNGHPVQSSLDNFLQNPEVLNRYSLVLFVTPSNPNLNLSLVSRFCNKNAIPLFQIHSVGFFSKFSVQLPDHFPILDTHPDPASTIDLRLLQPWPELHEFMKSKTKDLDTLSDHDHGHLPYLLLLLRFLDDWKQSHDGNPPGDYSEKKQFKTFIESKARTNNPEGGEENFDEAAASVLKSLNKPSLPSGLRTIFAELDNKQLDRDSSNFWLIAKAIQQFHSDHASLPLPGALPDMKAQSKDYIQLQNIYKAKARQDAEAVTSHVRAMEEAQKRESAIDPKEIEAFCKGAAFVKLIKGQPLVTEVDIPRLKPIYRDLKDEDSPLPIYIAFLAYDAMVAKVADKPSEADSEQEPLENLKNHTKNIIEKLAAAANDNDEQLQSDIIARIEPILEELVRADGAELHNISALTGGMVAQEAIKVLTKQYIPIDNTCVFDGIASKSAVFRV
ncbi:MAG: hypothetical protein LQ343_006956 [Gyalolechia ehrenbergii]|nr:MAG: hypothetical protein LQ343_006956 [Gyalolechia ehrenbergii]